MGHSQSFIIAYFMNPALAAVYDITTKVCGVACTFVSQTNGSFFALFSLTMATKDHNRINDVFKKTSTFFFVSLLSVALFSICFSEPIIKYWVGLDKFGGTMLLGVAVMATILGQIRRYFNNIIYTGGLINKSAKLDILCMFVYLLVLVAIIKYVQVYAVPLAGALSCLVFMIWYMRIMKKDLHIDIRMMTKIALTSTLIIIPFVVIHFILRFDYNHIISYIVYVVSFTVVYGFVVYLTNKDFTKMLLSKIQR